MSTRSRDARLLPGGGHLAEWIARFDWTAVGLPMVGNGLLGPGMDVSTKPFDLGVLASKVRAVIGR